MLIIIGSLMGLVLMSMLIYDWLMILIGILILFFLVVEKNCKWFIFNFMGVVYGMDFLSYSLVLLSIWITLLMIISSMSTNWMMDYSNELNLLFVILLSFLTTSFLSSSMLWFYLMFEASLIPTLMMILGWGYQPERIQAGVYLMLYTLFLSMPLLLVIFSVWKFKGTDSFTFDYLLMDNLFYWCFIMAFLVKMPMFFFHLWLPSAHVEAPVAGSMILAGILLKLGGYGLLRIFSLLKVHMILSNIIMSVGMVGGMITAFICMGQMDMKSLVAYSSIGHMSLAIAGIFSFNWMGMSGGLMMLISHGLCSSGLFCAVNMMYEKMGSRNIMISKGLMNTLPSFALWWFLLCSCNMSAPPSLSLGSEILLYCSLMNWSLFFIMVLIMLSFMTGAYSLFLFSFSQHGLSLNKYSITNINLREYFLMLSHWLPLNLLIIWLELFF